MTPALFSLISLIFLTAITPGPNNFIILGHSVKNGVLACLPSLIAILFGTQFVLLLIIFGFDAAFNITTWLRSLMILIGASFLVWASLKMIFEKKSGLTKPAQNFTLAGLFFFQILNPKTWILVGTSYAAFSAMTLGNNFEDIYFALMILLITAPCLLVWASAGQLLKDRLSSEFTGTYVQKGLGLAMMMSAIGLMTLA